MENKKRKWSRIRDLTRQQFGELEVLELSEKKSKNHSAVWRCRCNACGREDVDVGRTELLHGGYTSCGCLRDNKRDFGLRKYVERDRIEGTRKSALKAKLHVNNKTGIKGVIYMPSRGKYKAYLGFQGKQITLGYFAKLEDAAAARQSGEQIYHRPITDVEPEA